MIRLLLISFQYELVPLKTLPELRYPYVKRSLIKSTDPSEIKKAITDVVSKGFYLNNFVNRILLKKSHNKSRTLPSLNNTLDVSEKERNVLNYICMEFTSIEIGEKMHISSRTVESIKERMMERFGLKNTAGLVFFAVKNNLID